MGVSMLNNHQVNRSQLTLNRDELYNKARKKLIDFSSTIDRLRDVGVAKKAYQGEKDSHIVVTYPPTFSLQSIGRTAIYDEPHYLHKRNTLYVHVPFCSGICTYCSYARSAKEENDPAIDIYLEGLSREAALLREAAGQIRIPLESIYIGGGTPTILNGKKLEKFFNIIEQNFDLAENGEYSLEGSPETITSDKINTAFEFGVNRVSIGVESFDDNILRRMQRRHNASSIFHALDKIRQEGIDNIDFDLIRGFVGQTPLEMETDLLGVKKAQVSSVTSYQFNVKRKSKDYKNLNEMEHSYHKKQSDQLFLHLLFNEGMTQLGYYQLPIDTYIQNKTHVYRHQMLKWQDMTNQIVLGPGAYGYLNNTQFINLVGKSYYNSIREGRLPVAREIKLSPEEVMRRRLIFGLKTGLARKDFAKDYGMDILETPFSKTLENLIDVGVIVMDSDNVSLNEIGSLFADWIQQCFYSENAIDLSQEIS